MKDPNGNVARALAACTNAGVNPRQYAGLWVKRALDPTAKRMCQVVAGMGPKYWDALVEHYRDGDSK